MQRNGIDLIFHHMGVPTAKMSLNERYSPVFGMYTSDSPCHTMRVQWHRFDESSTLHPLIRTVPHVAFKVANLTTAIEGSELLLEPYEPIPGFRVAIIQDGGIPIELLETTLTDDEIWAGTGEPSLLYPAKTPIICPG